MTATHGTMSFSATELEAYGTALENSVCSHCVSSGYERECRIGVSGECPIRAHLPAIVEAVLTTPQSSCMVDYVPRIRDGVCAHCPRQDADGECRARDSAACGLDSMLCLVVETVEEVHERLSGNSTPTVKLETVKR